MNDDAPTPDVSPGGAIAAAAPPGALTAAPPLHSDDPAGRRHGDGPARELARPDQRGLRIARLTLSVRDLTAVREFYVGALGFQPAAGGTDGAVRLRLGAQEIELAPAPSTSAPYPEPRAANDPWFQHFAVAVADMDAAYARLSQFAPEPISRGGPQRLPANTGSVTAYKFRDPEGRPLELSHAPQGPWTAVVQAAPGAVFLGIDHTAVAVADLEASLAFYGDLGFAETGRSLNRGPEQARLDGLEDAMVDIAVLAPPGAGPHLELLHYRTPGSAPRRGVAQGDIAATVTVLALADATPAAAGARALTDPDRHRLLITA